MNIHFNPEERLSVLRLGDLYRNWNSLDDQRVCAVCERKFNGRQVDIRRLPGGRYKLQCPTLGCPSAAQQWLYPGAPLASDIVDPDWWRAKKKRSRPLSGAVGIQG